MTDPLDDIINNRDAYVDGSDYMINMYGVGQDEAEDMEEDDE